MTQTVGRGCGVGQPGNVCDAQPVVGVLAVHIYPDAFHLDDEPTFGIVLMCADHFTAQPGKVF